MASNKKTRKKSAPKRRKLSPLDYKRVTRLALQLYCYRYMEDGDPHEMETYYDFRSFVPTHKRDHLHNVALNLRLHWHCVTITYCRNEFGKEYRLFGFAQTGQTIVAMREGIVPLMTAAMKDGESTANTKHIYARAMVVAPWSKGFNDLVPLVKAKQKFLKLHDKDIEEIAGYQKLKFETYVYDPDEVLNIDQQIANLLR